MMENINPFPFHSITGNPERKTLTLSAFPQVYVRVHLWKTLTFSLIGRKAYIYNIYIKTPFPPSGRTCRDKYKGAMTTPLDYTQTTTPEQDYADFPKKKNRKAIKMKTVKIRFPESLYAKIKKVAETNNLSINSVIRKCVIYAANRNMTDSKSVVTLKKQYTTTHCKRETSVVVKAELSEWMPDDCKLIRALLWHRLKDMQIQEPAALNIHSDDIKYMEAAQ